jgi:hypothetical protein
VAVVSKNMLRRAVKEIPTLNFQPTIWKILTLVEAPHRCHEWVYKLGTLKLHVLYCRKGLSRIKISVSAILKCIFTVHFSYVGLEITPVARLVGVAYRPALQENDPLSRSFVRRVAMEKSSPREIVAQRGLVRHSPPLQRHVLCGFRRTPHASQHRSKEKSCHP